MTIAKLLTHTYALGLYLSLFIVVTVWESCTYLGETFRVVQNGGKVSPELHQFETKSYIYQLNNKTYVRGLPFQAHALEKTPSYYIDIDTYDLTNFTFLTAASSNHFQESTDLIASIQKFFPRKKIYYYDIGLTSEQIKKIRSWCNVVYKKWNLNMYPKHIQHFYSSGFKPLIIYEMMQSFDAIFWLDSSGRLSPKANHSDWSSVYSTVRATDGIVQFDTTGRDTFQCTTQGMYRYLPADQKKLKTFMMVGAGILLLYRTETVFHKILNWWRLCALTKDCIEPEGHKVDCGARSVRGVAICHRYDQSALNILVANMLQYEDKRVPNGEKLIEVHRHPTKFYSLRTGCDKS